MVKRGGGTKRKIKMEKITRREYLATTFNKRCSGLHSKASQLCLLSGAQIAILATPPSSQSNVSFYSFGHSSVDAVVNAYLTGQRLAPVREEKREEDIGILMARKELGLEMWWEKESLSRSKDPRELMDAMKAMERVLCKLRSKDFVSNYNQRDHEDVKNNEKTQSDVVLHQGTQDLDETLNLQASCCCIPEFATGFDNSTEERDQTLAICDSFCAEENNNNNNSISALDWSDHDLLSIDELIDFETSYENCSAFDYGVLDSTTQELHETEGSLLNNFEAAHDVSTNPPYPPISVDYGVEEEA